MQKLNKKQQKIINDINRAIQPNLTGLKNFGDHGRYEMVLNSQTQIKHQLTGIANYIICTNHKDWDRRLEAAYWEIRKMHLLSIDYYYEVLESEDFISEADYQKYFAA